MTLGDRGIKTIERTTKKGVFISRILDSKEIQMQWHRLRFCGNEGQLAVKLSIYAGNEEEFVYEGQKLSLESFLKREDISLEEKKERISPWLQKEVSGKNDVLLYGVTGRYLWIILEMYWQPDQEEIYNLQIFFPKRSWVEYLPEIYQQEDESLFLQRFLGIFQSIYEDLDEEIWELPKNLDMELADASYLNWLAAWLDIKNGYIWPEEKKRLLLKNGISLYKKRGTREGLLDFVELYLGKRPFLVEQHQIRPFKKEEQKYKDLTALYGNDPYSFSLLVEEAYISSIRQQKALLKIIDEVKPAHMECNLVILRPYLFVGQPTYLGINSVLGKYSSLTLNGHSALPFTVLEEK